MENENREKLTFTYSAKQQEEIKKIRAKYAPPAEIEDKMAQLRRLDASVTQKGTTVALIVGVISALILGVGMCCCMVWADTLFVPGIIIGIIGIAVLGAAHPLYMRITEKQREKLAPEILRLTEELMK